MFGGLHGLLRFLPVGFVSLVALFQGGFHPVVEGCLGGFVGCEAHSGGPPFSLVPNTGWGKGTLGGLADVLPLFPVEDVLDPAVGEGVCILGQWRGGVTLVA